MARVAGKLLDSVLILASAPASGADTRAAIFERLRPPLRPSWRAVSSRARVRSTVSSRSISARLAMTWKKNRPERL